MIIFDRQDPGFGYDSGKPSMQGIRFLLELLLLGLVLCVILKVAFPYWLARLHQIQHEEQMSAGNQIQVAIERYATDNNKYPPFLYGGDTRSTFTTDLSDLDPLKEGAGLGLDFSDYNGDPRAIPGDCDALLQYGYIEKYPRNPFVRRRGNTLLISEPRDATRSRTIPYLRINLSSVPRAGSSKLGEINGWKNSLPRVPAGIDGSLMWDVSEGQRHPPFMVLVPGERAGSWYAPPAGTKGVTITADMHDDTDAAGMTLNTGKDTALHPALPGNFYYYPVLGNPSNWNIYYAGCSPQTESYKGFRLAFYGNCDNPGQDVYDMFGDFEDRMISGYIDNLNVIEADVGNIGGPDGREDGVAIVLTSTVRIINPSVKSGTEDNVSNGY